MTYDLTSPEDRFLSRVAKNKTMISEVQTAPRKTRTFSLQVARGLDEASPTVTEHERLVFVHFPKTAGTSFSHFLRRFYSFEETLPEEEVAAGPGSWSAESKRRCRYFQGHLPYPLALALVGQAHYVTFLRDPIERILSQYLQWQVDRLPDRQKRILSKHPRQQAIVSRASQLPFDRWVRAQDAGQECYLTNLQTWGLAGPEKVWATGQAPRDCTPTDLENLFENAKRVLRHEFCFFGLTEQYERSLHLLCFMFGLPGSFARTRDTCNTRPSRQAVPDIDSETIEILRSQNSLDYRLYDFAQDLFEQRHTFAIARLLDTVPSWGKSIPARLAGEDIELLPDNPSFVATGLHGTEEGDGVSYAWTGALPVTTVYFEADFTCHHRMQVTIEAIATIEDDAWNQLEVRFDGEPLRDVKRENRQGRLVATGRVHMDPRAARFSNRHIIELEGPLHQPESEKMGPRDFRHLGIALCRVGITTCTEYETTEDGSADAPCCDHGSTTTVDPVESACVAAPSSDEAQRSICELREEVREVREELISIWHVRDLLQQTIERLGRVEEQICSSWHGDLTP